MRVFNLFFKITKSKLPSGLIYVIVFFAICFPMSQAGSSQLSFKETELKIAVFDEDGSAESKSLVEHIAKNNEIKDIKNDPKLILDAMYYEQIDYTLTIKKGYGERISDTDKDAVKEPLFETYHLHDSYATAMMEQYLDEYVRMVRSYVAGGNDTAGAIKKTQERIDKKAEVSFAEFDSGQVKDENYPDDFSFVFRYMPYVLISVLINVLCPVLLVMRKKDQRYRMNCSSTNMKSFTGQVFAGSTVLVLAIWLLFMIGAMVMYGGIFRGTNCWIAVLNSFVFGLISAALAILIASFSPSENVVSMITQCVGLGMCFLCGVFVPQTMLSEGVLKAAKFLPAYWYEKVNDILSGSQSGTMGDVWMGILIEVGFLVALILVTAFVSMQRPQGSTLKIRKKSAA